MAMTIPPPLPILGMMKLNGLETQIVCIKPQVCFFSFFVLILLTAIIYRFLIMIYMMLGTNGTGERKKKGGRLDLIWSNFHWALTLCSALPQCCNILPTTVMHSTR